MDAAILDRRLGKTPWLPSNEIPPTGRGLQVVSEDIAYYGKTRGFCAWPLQHPESPGIVMIHEWWGLNQYIRNIARFLASEGYRVLAVDLFGNQADTAKEAMRLVSTLDQEEALRNLTASVSYLRFQGSRAIASLGWCFGGGQSMRLAVSGLKLDATVIYYGEPITDTVLLKAIDWPVLAFYGGRDATIPIEKVREFSAALSYLNIDHSIMVYPSVGHAFANPSNVNFSPGETGDAWGKTLKFLDSTLRKL